jgi:L-lactate dehydrogenase complex protein LldE
MRVALFIACYNDVLFPDTGRAVTTVLERLGHTVEFPMAQTCCGQMHHNTGYRREAESLIGAFTDAFRGYDAIVTPSGSCAGHVRHHHGMRDGSRGETNSPSVYEFSEFLVDVLGVTDVGAYYPHRVTYHPTCHSLRMLRVGDKPLRLLRAVEGIDLVELPEAESCCGFGGTFAMKNADTSVAMLRDKMGNIRKTDADTVCASDNSCLMHIGGGLARIKSGVRTLHLAEILAASA